MSLKIIYIIFSDYDQQNIFKKHAKLIFLCAKKIDKYTFFNVPDHVYSEMVKLNGVEFKSKQVVFEGVKTKHKECTLNKKNSPDHQFKNHFLDVTYQYEQNQGHQHHQQQQRQKEQHKH